MRQLSLRTQALSKARRRQNIGFGAGSLVALACLVILFWPGQERWHQSGPMNTGHEMLNCTACHKPAPGAIRQQLQVNVRAALGLRKSAVDFGLQAVGNDTCLTCHNRANDRHPVFRFLEPRFAEARVQLQPQFCGACHQEHTCQRVTVEPTFCVQCHQETKLNNDPISISHRQLIAAQKWDSCLGCHDFHGNHVMQTETDVAKGFTRQQILDYFAGGPSPYPTERYYPAQREVINE